MYGGKQSVKRKEKIIIRDKQKKSLVGKIVRKGFRKRLRLLPHSKNREKKRKKASSAV